MAGSRPLAVCPQDPPHSCCAYVVAGPGEFPAHPAIPPGLILSREPQHQIPASLDACPRPGSASQPNTRVTIRQGSG